MRLFLYWILCIDFCLFVGKILHEFFFLEKVHIYPNGNNYPHHVLPKIIKNNFVIIDKKYSEKIDARCPENRTNYVIDPETLFEHTSTSSNKWNKGSSKIMKFPKQDIPESVFLELFVEDFFFCFPKSEPVTIFLDEFFSIVFSYPVAEIVPNHCSNDGERDSDEEMITRPESSYEDHNIHPWNRSSDDWQ